MDASVEAPCAWGCMLLCMLRMGGGTIFPLSAISASIIAAGLKLTRVLLVTPFRTSPVQLAKPCEGVPAREGAPSPALPKSPRLSPEVALRGAP